MKSILRDMSIKQAWKPKYFDIGVNFSDSMFQGYYNHSSNQKHPPDLHKVIERAHLFNVDKMLVTASNIKESEDHFSLCDQFPNAFYSTVGVHPCTAAEEFYVKNENGTYTEELRADCQLKLSKLHDLVVEGVKRGNVKAFGEIGLDYDRFHYSSKNQQITVFKKQLEVIASLNHLELPLFLHMRNACDDFVEILKPFIDDGSIKLGNGVVHSFTGTEDELKKLLDLGFYIGVNGCSLKNEENLKVAALIPNNKLMIETDAPWCEIRKSHAGFKYISPYPNKFYPEIGQVQDVPLVEPKKNQPTIKLDDFIPFPSIKKENYQKHLLAVETLNQGSANSSIGYFAAPVIKSRNEPVFVGLVGEILCNLHNLNNEEDIEDFLDTVYNNSCKLFKV